MAYLSHWPHVRGGCGSRCSTVVYTHCVVVANMRGGSGGGDSGDSGGSGGSYCCCSPASAALARLVALSCMSKGFVSDWLTDPFGCWLQFKWVSGRQ